MYNNIFNYIFHKGGKKPPRLQLEKGFQKKPIVELHSIHTRLLYNMTKNVWSHSFASCAIPNHT